ncbi:Hypothetical predicted protein [Mytilus galloprovincialis]|uniref:CCHC-type domain-containing protein n=1 Tax=Mytilus galloprovincialis TaxID=29158 RepID=A0A8B6EL68_MYTGA|nr:Hypothetical predicted protein [Mytilus galloprovincialis]
MAFDAGNFLKTPDLENFDNLKKEELVLLAKHLKLDFRVSMRKQIIKNLVIDKLVDEEILELEMKETEKIKELEMKERLEMDKKEKEDELKLKELEMRERLEMVKEESNTKVQSKSEYFDAAKNIHNYTLSHKRSFQGQNVNTSSGNYKNQSTERTESKPVAQNKRQSSYNMSSPKFDTFEKKSLICAYCKKNGHLMADCFRLQKKNERDNKPKSSACTTPYITSTLECPASQAFKSSFCDYMEEYKPFMSDGFVSIVDYTNLQPIKILRDTRASQSLLLEGVLPLFEKTSVGASVLLQGVELGCIDVPLHRIYLKSDLITGPVIVGVRPNLPVEGVT